MTAKTKSSNERTNLVATNRFRNTAAARILFSTVHVTAFGRNCKELPPFILIPRISGDGLLHPRVSATGVTRGFHKLALRRANGLKLDLARIRSSGLSTNGTSMIQ